MSVKPTKDGKFRVEIDRKGVPRTRKLFLSRKEAEEFEREYLFRYKESVKQSRDGRLLTDLIELWFVYHGINLADGERRKKALLDMARELKNPPGAGLTAEQFVQWRYKRTTSGGVTHKTANNLQGYLCAVFNKLHKLKVIDYHNPIGQVEFIKIQERQLSYLNDAQIDTLFDSIKTGCVNESTFYVAQLCLRTGARWGEAERMRRKQLHDCRVTYEFTKSKRTRSVPVERPFFNELDTLFRYKNPDDRLFLNCIGSFRRAVARTDLQLPKGQMTHILRHTFASHFIMNGGNILTLQKILGHADISQTMRYAHLAPDHFMDAVKLNPLVGKWR